MCSRKWETPACPGASLRDPVRTQRPSATDRTEAISSVTTRTPEAVSVLRTSNAEPAISPLAPLAALAARGPPVTAAATLAAASAAAAIAGADRGQLLGALALDSGVVGEAQADAPALLVHLDDGDVDLLAGLQHVIDCVDALARLHVGDVEQAVRPLRQLDEGAEGGRLHDLGAVVAVADPGLAGHRLDPGDRRLDQIAGRRVDPHRSVVLDVDLGLELLLHAADRL